jgi:predicted ATP-binding protein involved in virulence
LVTPQGKGADSAHAPSIMMIDEIDLHLHPSWQQRVPGDLMTAFPNTQFIVTTHSPQVLSTVPKESIRMIRRDADDRQLDVPEFQPMCSIG